MVFGNETNIHTLINYEQDSAAEVAEQEVWSSCSQSLLLIDCHVDVTVGLNEWPCCGLVTCFVK